MEALILFVRTPELGKVKTRLAAGIGDSAALKVYQLLLARTQKLITQLTDIDVFVYHTPEIQEWAGVENRIQTQGDLGMRMFSALESVKKLGYERIVLIGSDCWDLKLKHLNRAFEVLKDKSLVLGPAKDGGYYLIGTTNPEVSLFTGISWSTSLVLEATLEKAKKNNLSYDLLETLSDIDFKEDLEGRIDWRIL